MEFEDLSPEMEWEARRVAAAFGVEKWLAWEKSARKLSDGIWPTIIYSAVSRSNETIHFEMELTFQAFSIQIENAEGGVLSTGLDFHRSGEKVLSVVTSSRRLSGVRSKPPSPKGSKSPSPRGAKDSHVLAHGMYCLGSKCCGFDFSQDPELIAIINDLSAHEKLELRLSMPREFWPQTWLDEEGA